MFSRHAGMPCNHSDAAICSTLQQVLRAVDSLSAALDPALRTSEQLRSLNAMGPEEHVTILPTSSASGLPPLKTEISFHSRCQKL